MNLGPKGLAWEPTRSAADCEIDEWASRLLGAPAVVIEADASRVVALLHGGTEPVVSSASYDFCPCRQFQRSACVGCPGKPRCKHTRSLGRMRRVLRAREERAQLDEIRRLGAAGTAGKSTGARGSSPFHPLAPARPGKRA